MFGSVPSSRPPVAGIPAGQQRFNRRTQEQLAELSRFQGLGIQGGTMPTQVPAIPQFIVGQIWDEETGSGSGSYAGSGNFSLNPAGAGFTDEEGYLVYAFDQIYDTAPWKGEIIVEGIRTTLPTETTDGANYAYPLNQDVWEVGANVLLMRAGKHWIIVGATGAAGGSGNGGYTINCNDGTSYPVTFGSRTITIGNPI